MGSQERERLVRERFARTVQEVRAATQREMERRGWSVEDVAEKTGVSAAEFRRYVEDGDDVSCNDLLGPWIVLEVDVNGIHNAI